jgi:enoyl-CoA hydratase/carnithine racemase
MIALDVAGAVATIRLDRPEARNALSRAGWLALHDAAHEVAARGATVAVLRSGVSGIFSAGADLAELARLHDHPDERAPFRQAMRAGIDALAALPMPSVALVDGACLGAAVALALACDFVVATPAARFAVPPARLGIVYPRQDVARLAARVGQGAAARLLFTAETIDAAEARRIGLAGLVTDAPDETVARIAANDPAALAALKHVLRTPHDPAHDAAFDEGFANPTFAAATAAFRKD